jgi:hypothetical protein
MKHIKLFEQFINENEDENRRHREGWEKLTDKEVIAVIKRNGIISYKGMLSVGYEPSEAVKAGSLKIDPQILQHIENPSEELQLIAVSQDSFKKFNMTRHERADFENAIRWIKNPSEKVQLAAVTVSGNAIQFIKNPSEKVQLAAVEQFNGALRFIEKPSEKVQLAAVEKSHPVYGDLPIKYISNPSEKIQLVSIGKFDASIKFIQNPTEKAQLAAVEKDGSNLRYIKNPSPKVIAAALPSITDSQFRAYPELQLYKK